MPVGMKNRPDGSVGTAVDAIRAAGVPHIFTGIDESGTPAILHTRGNADCHLILRGGAAGPNYHAEAVNDALRRLRGAGLPERLVIDASHGNSGKDHERQPLVAADLAIQLEAGQRGIVGGVPAARPASTARQPTAPPAHGRWEYGRSQPTPPGVTSGSTAPRTSRRPARSSEEAGSSNQAT